MTNRELAKLAQISEATVSRVLSTKGANASAATITAICEALGVHTEASHYEVIAHTPGNCVGCAGRIDDLKATIQQKECWNKRLFIVCICLAAFVFILFAVDIFNPAVGWFRG